jgi:surface carbohydrate biosynthesis protein
MRVLIVEEHPERERLALRLLARTLVSRGHEVHFTDTWRLERDTRRLAPDLALDNVSDSVAHFVGKWATLGPQQRNVNLIWEQFVNPANQFRFRFDEHLSSRLVDGRVAWGEAFRDALLMENPAMDPSRVRVCGSIKHAAQVGLAHVPKDALLERLDPRLRSRQKRVLFVDSYPAAMRDPMADRALTGERPLPYLYEVIRYLQDLREPAIALLRALATANPDVLFIVRLHPTKLQNYRQHFEDLERVPNVVVESEGDIGPLICVSDLVIAARSGSLVEAHLARVPAVNLSLDAHPFRRLGLTATVEELFAPEVPLDGGACPTLEELERIARGHSPERRVVETWTHDPGARTFERVASFLEETVSRDAVRRDLPGSVALSRRVLRRKARLAVRGLGAGKMPAPYAETVDFDGLVELVARAEVPAEAQSTS